MKRPNIDDYPLKIDGKLHYYNTDLKKYIDFIEAENKQLRLHVVTFCLPIEGDTFISWHSRYFKLNTDGSVVAIKNETIKYTQDQMLELWNFLTDRLLAN